MGSPASAPSTSPFIFLVPPLTMGSRERGYVVGQPIGKCLFTALGVFCTLKTTSARIIHFAEVSIHLCELLDAISDAAAAGQHKRRYYIVVRQRIEMLHCHYVVFQQR